MPRRRRGLLDRTCYHVTHRCHKREFLFRFAQDRQRYMEILAGNLAAIQGGSEGAFWRDRFHSTMIETGTHLSRCLFYADIHLSRQINQQMRNSRKIMATFESAKIRSNSMAASRLREWREETPPASQEKRKRLPFRDFPGKC